MRAMKILHQNDIYHAYGYFLHLKINRPYHYSSSWHSVDELSALISPNVRAAATEKIVAKVCESVYAIDIASLTEKLLRRK